MSAKSSPGPHPRVEARYCGFVTTNTGQKKVMVRCKGQKDKLLPKRTEVRNHSPDGFSWGYGGSSSAQLALAIMVDFLGESEKAEKIYQDFKDEVIARIPQDAKDWEITGQQILETECYKLTLVSEVMES